MESPKEQKNAVSTSNDSLRNADASTQHVVMEQIEALPSSTTTQCRLASIDRQLTHVAELQSIEFGDPVLDPTKPEFDVYKWANMILRVADKAGFKFRRASLTFHNLVISGSGSAELFQTNVGSIFMAPFRLHEYFSFAEKPKKTILKSFDGIMRSGELLLVLGRPGSGCSTFLKTIAGELDGLMMDENSVMHYNGTIFTEYFFAKYEC